MAMGWGNLGCGRTRRVKDVQGEADVLCHSVFSLRRGLRSAAIGHSVLNTATADKRIAA
jgi:hypothetical protein